MRSPLCNVYTRRQADDCGTVCRVQKLYEMGGDREVKDKVANVFWYTWLGIMIFLGGVMAGAAAKGYVMEKRAEEKPAYSVYDLNLDGLVNSTDSRICYDIFTGFRVATPDMLERADVTGDGLVDDADVVAIMDAVLGKVEE